ncbi:MAG: CoA transferase [Chloroflexi bacterium]|nr:CoA transferase [Chloroflexota bacterium]
MPPTNAAGLPLSPYRVLDLTNEIGFLCGRILGDLGADVIKVEPPGGDPARNHGPYYHDDVDPEKSLYWYAYNYNKRSVTLDLSQPPGRDVFARLSAEADFIVETGPPGHMEALGLGYEDLRSANPRLLMTAITPFGQTGPYSQYKADDIVAVAVGGLMNLCGDEDREPLRIGVPQAYALAGAQAAAGTMIAHYQRLMTGQGAYVDVSMQEAVANALPATQLEWFVSKEVTRRGDRHPYGGRMTRGTFPAKDGFVASHLFWGVGPGTRMKGLAQWIKDTGQETTIGDVDFTKVTGFSITQEQVDAWEEEMSSFFSRFTKAEIYREALRRRAFVFPVSTPADLAEDPQLKARDFFKPVEHPDLGSVIDYPGPFCGFSETPLSIRRPPPLIGEHNAEIYEALGYSRQELNDLKKAGVI